MQKLAIYRNGSRVNGQQSVETRYYISSLASNATKVAEAVRTHWSIENSLHWVLDVSFDEDACRIRSYHAPQNMTLLRQIALNLLGQDKSTKIGIAARRKKAGWDDAYLVKNSGSVIFMRLPCNQCLAAGRNGNVPLKSTAGDALILDYAHRKFRYQ